MSRCSIFLTLFLAGPLQASEIRDELQSLGENSFRILEVTKIILDGSPQASDIQRESHISNRVTYLNEFKWRAKRKLPFSENVREILHLDKDYFVMTASNRRLPAREQYTQKFWEEIVLTPLQLAKEWSFAEPSDTFESFWKKLEKSKSPLTNVDGDKIEYQFTENNGLKLFASGKIIQDGKTRIKVETSWELKDRAKVKEEELQNPLLKE